MTDLPRLLGALADHEVQFIVVGGVAAFAHGSARVTFVLDCVYEREPRNLERLERALAPLSPTLRDAPPELSFHFDEATLRNGFNFPLATSAGPIDLRGGVAGGGTYQSLLADSIEVLVFERQCRVVTLERLIALKRAAGRPKDLEAIAELEALRDEGRS